MTKEELIEQLEDMLMLDSGELVLNKELVDYEDWDSMSYLTLIAMFDTKLNKKLSVGTIKEFRTPNDIIKHAGL
ncbi:acyl carrier protein [Aliarcobacter butzleri]|uniref:acyl carrier protein n=1 Tax=Aliarcobacter butzleri TaxID=28197 RepID=UPI003AF495C8